MLLEKNLNFSTVYLDTCIFIYFLENHPRWGNRATAFFKQAEEGQMGLLASPLVLQEIMTGIYKLRTQHAEEIYSALATVKNLEWCPYTLEVADLGAKIRSELGIKTPDAVHLATAHVYRAKKFITNDQEIKGKEKYFPFKIELFA